MLLRSVLNPWVPRVGRRLYRILAIESSCDDSCVALLDRKSPTSTPDIVDEAKVTLNSAKVGGIIPTAAHEFHQISIAKLIQGFCHKHNLTAQSPPDLICVTRGPGMVGSLSASLQFAKGLAVAWNRPLVGVHHMLGHLLTAMLPSKENAGTQPQYPFLSLLCSGGHTMLVLLRSLTDHQVIINTSDIAAGDSIDKCARELGLTGNMLGPELERYVESIDLETRLKFASANHSTGENDFDFKLRMPMRSPKHKKIPDVIEFGFASFLSTIEGYKSAKFANEPMDAITKRFVAFKLQEVLFDHIINRINVAFIKHGNVGDESDGLFAGVQDFVCSGGVAANSTLRQKLFHNLNSGTPLKFHFPDLRLCTDNATMIGNAGMFIFEELRVKSDFGILPIRKWPMDELLVADGWDKVSEEEFALVTGWK